jgi:hypothetical protein
MKGNIVALTDPVKEEGEEVHTCKIPSKHIFRILSMY